MLILFRIICKFRHFIPAGLQPSSKHSGYPVRMDNSVPMVPQNQSAQSLHIQPSMLTQVTLVCVSLCECVCKIENSVPVFRFPVCPACDVAFSVHSASSNEMICEIEQRVYVRYSFLSEPMVLVTQFLFFICGFTV